MLSSLAGVFSPSYLHLYEQGKELDSEVLGLIVFTARVLYADLRAI